MVVVWTHYPWLYPVIFHRRNENGQGLSMEHFFRNWHGIDRHWIDGQDPFHLDLETVLHLFRGKSGKPENHRSRIVQIYQASRISRSMDNFLWNFNFDIQLVIHSYHDGPCNCGIPLSDTSGGKIYDQRTGRRLLELPDTDEKDHPIDLLRILRRYKLLYFERCAIYLIYICTDPGNQAVHLPARHCPTHTPDRVVER